MTDLRYPIGNFEKPASISSDQRAKLIRDIEETPAKLRSAVAGLSEKQLDTPYRPGGWTVRQVVHHLPDSHMNAYTRHKLTVTEDNPTIKPYEEARWAELIDGKAAPTAVSIQLLEALHSRWVAFLKSLKPEQFSRTFRHPESGDWTLDQSIAMYGWHGKHHVAHITELRSREGF